MAQPTEPKKKRRKKRRPKKRTERRFEAEPTTMNKTYAIAGMVGAAVLGVGVYGQWVRDQVLQAPPMEHAQWIVVAGALGLAAVLWFGDKTSHPVRVGDAGIAVEKGNDVLRIAWCDMEELRVEGGQLVAIGDDLTLTIPLAAQPKAVTWALKECVERVPDVLNVRPRDQEGLPEPHDDDGELIEVEDVQIAGRECAASGKVISFERDARLCPKCGEVYHKQHVPKRCETCDARVGDRAVAA